MVGFSAVQSDPCPFIDDDDPRCDCRFKLDRLHEAFSLCFDGYRGCATYYKLLHDHPPQFIRLTAHGRQLQPTGT